MRQRAWALLKRYFLDALVVLGAIVGTIEILRGREEADGPQGPAWLLVATVLVMTLPLLLRRQYPFGAPTAVFVGAAAVSFIEGTVVPHSSATFLGAMAACFVFGLVKEPALAVAGFGVALAGAAVVSANDPSGGVGEIVWIAFPFAVFWIAGFVVGRKLEEAAEARERAARAEREREERAQQAVADERARIARELHDVVAHSVSVMTVQAGAVRRLLKPDQEREREALEVVEQTGREALAEMRRMVGVMRRPEEGPALAPQPGVEHLERLVAHAREAGLPVHLRIEGDPAPLPPGIDLAAYRVVQEGLTNARKHANAERVEVLVRYGGEHVELTVADDGRGAEGGDGRGHGLVGMRERIALYGGELEAGPKRGGGYELHARLPLRGET